MPSPGRVLMSDFDDALKVTEALEAAKSAPPQMALSMLNGLIDLARGGDDQPLEVSEARSTVFLALCDIGKALHRGQPADHLWANAIGAANRWRALVS